MDPLDSDARLRALGPKPSAPAASGPAVRAVMKGNVGRDTKPEVRVRSELHRRGLRFRKHTAPIAGLRCRADVLFGPEQVAVFVDGCFWHGCPEHGRIPGSNAGYWADKLARNTARDQRNNEILNSHGWIVVRAWEHEAPSDVADRVEAAVWKRRGVRV